jgi:hypothetical protein
MTIVKDSDLKKRLAPWQEEIRERVEQLEHRAADTHTNSDEVLRLLQQAWTAGTKRSSPSGWWRGSEVELAWSNLHEAEAQITEHTTEPTALQAEARASLVQARHFVPHDDQNATKLKELVMAGSTGDDVRATASAVLRAANVESDQQHKEARALRNRILRVTLMLVALAGVLVVLQWRLPSASMISAPKGVKNVPAWALLLMVMALGCLGGFLTAIPAVTRTPRTRSPFNVSLQQTLLKLVLGALTAVVGVMIVGSVMVSNGLQSVASMLVLAVAFGSGQQAVTGFVDQYAKKILTTNATAARQNP